MMSVYELFKIILSIILAVMVLVFISTYISSYIRIDKVSKETKALKGFRETARSVYLSGADTVFEEFPSFSQRCEVMAETHRHRLVCGNTKIEMDIPVIFAQNTVETKAGGEKTEQLILHRTQKDFGWFSVYLLEAMPETRIIISPMSFDSGDEEILERALEALPDTSGLPDVAVVIAVCSGSSISCGTGDSCTAGDLLGIFHSINSVGAPSGCTASLQEDDRLLIFDDSCRSGTLSRGLCVGPASPTGLRKMYSGGREYLYKDEFDLISLLLPAEAKNIGGIYLAENSYENKNEFFRKHLKLASDSARKKSEMLRNQADADCVPDLIDMSSCLLGLSGYLSNENYYNSPAASKTVYDAIESCAGFYSRLVERGCEYGY